MKTMKWLIKREIWENKGMLVWTPLAVAAVIAAIAIFLGHIVRYNMSQGAALPVGQPAGDSHMRDHLLYNVTHSSLVPSLPLYILLGFLVFAYCLNTLHDEHRDRSLLFWKSLPVSDQKTVLSKAVLALIVAPLVIGVMAAALSLLLLAATCLALLTQGTNLFGALLTSSELYLIPLRPLGILPVYVLWALPTVGWLLLVSSVARSKVFLWAIGTPVVTALLLLWAERSLHLAIDTGWFVEHVVRRILLGVLPGVWILFERHGESTMEAFGKLAGQALGQPDLLLSASWSTLGGASVWVGAAAGVAMIAGAVWMRRCREG